ncbi:MAG: translation initiation factor IF-2 subunit beta [Candidatus Marsarchaeota archaeon]|jgi:translation initiation factor 2 subunit 2|nr:translation initiation factor IF-2 subunit beta [Candidatus Marsarchaeota archaeon]MCL5418836.1 translation initiation factor IF-2 subunit beta [Candidatus Marsarchaeota archaeon]
MSDEDYEKLLDRAFSQLPTLSASKEDFVIPRADMLIQGSKTIIRNLYPIADKARRKPEDIARYISKELSVPVSIDEQRMTISGRFTQDELDAKIHKYFEIYVICKECHKPDTHLESADRGMYIVCEACGARYWVKGY